MNYIFSIQDKETGDWLDQTSLDENNIELAKEIFIEDGYDLSKCEVGLSEIVPDSEPECQFEH